MKRFKVYVTCTVMGTTIVDADNADDAQDKAESMGGEGVLSDMSKTDFDVCADDAEEIEEDVE